MVKRILLIERDEDVRDIMRYILVDEGWQVIYTESSYEPEALAAMGADLVIIDEWIADQPGHRLCLRLKQLENFGQVPVIIISTANHIEDIMAECQADDYIRKPFDLTELVAKVKRLLPVA